MDNLTRKERERQQRESLFLDIAYDILRNEGTKALTMERVAQIAEYSKGTVYGHFSCKEDIISALSVRTLMLQKAMMQMVLEGQCSTRERILGCALVYVLIQEKYPRLHYCILSLNDPQISTKLSNTMKELYGETEEQVKRLLVDTITEAQKNGDLPCEKPAESIAYAVRAMVFGMALIGHESLESATRCHLSTLLDGFGWQPLTCNADYQNFWQQTRESLLTVTIPELHDTSFF
ncbi:TetR/AcrR family transcriptional regulator [Photobacterium satsumensis]|uniref:TetR/AcrR family transcriptional regulator n=1 Tax=Photobacterium satsumensis TaxID=2910239 RepID=UPI003D1027B1